MIGNQPHFGRLQDFDIELRLYQCRLGFQIVKTPTTTSIQLNTTTIDVGFDTIMTVHTTPPTHHPTTQELYFSTTGIPWQCKLTLS